jgi:hypothetical protein
MYYFAGDGNYGDGNDIAIIHEVDDHIFDQIDGVQDWNRPAFAKWFEDNDHVFVEGDNAWDCVVCDEWLSANN